MRSDFDIRRELKVPWIIFNIVQWLVVYFRIGTLRSVFNTFLSHRHIIGWVVLLSVTNEAVQDAHILAIIVSAPTQIDAFDPPER